jgi:L-xylulokinase
MGQPSFRAGFYGLSPSTNKADILRAVYEGIAFSHNMSIEKLAEIVKINGNDVWLAGGGAASNIWGQVFADITGYNIKVAKANEIGARGAALSAGVGVGIFKDHKDANKLLEVRREYVPNAENVERYGEEFRIYKSLVENLSQASEDMCNLYQNW